MKTRLLTLSCAMLGAAGSSFAQTWDGGAGTGLWATANNWNPNAVPASGASLTFDGANANSQWNINLGANRTVTGITFISAIGSNPFTFSNNTLTVGSGGIANNDADTQVFNSNVTLNSSQSFSATSGGLTFGGNLSVGSNTLTVTGGSTTTFGGAVSGNGAITKQGAGALSWTGAGGFSGTFNLVAGSVTYVRSGNFSLGYNLNLTGGSFEIQSGGDFGGFGTAGINGGATLKITPGAEFSNLSGTITFGSTGGTLDLNGPMNSGASFGTVAVNSTSGTAYIKYGTIASGSTPFGWNTGGSDLNVFNGHLTGSGRLSFQLSGGAMVTYVQTTFNGEMNLTGVPGGSASAGSGSANVGRLLIGNTTVSFGGGLTFDNAMQVSVTGGNRIIDSAITINSGQTAFQGESRNGTARSLSLGSAVGGYSLTVKDGASAILDVRFRDDSGMNQVGNLILNNNTILENGGTLSLTKSATVGGEVVGSISVFGNITGQGTASKESIVSLNTSAFSFDSGSSLIVNGTTTGGLRVQGTKANVDAMLTSARLQGLSGSGGTFTIAYSDSGVRTNSVAPSVGRDVALGFDAQGGSAPTYYLGSSANDLANWGGLAVKGGTVQLRFDESLTGGAGATELNLLGGTLTLNDGSSARTLTLEGGANLSGGTLNGGSTAGTLVIGGNLVNGSANLVNNPNITMNVSGANNISGNAITGVGTLIKTGAGTVTLNTSLTANTIDIQSGTLLMGGNNQIGDSTAIRLSGGTLGTGGFSDTVGALTLASSSTIDFGNATSILSFANSSGSSWSGNLTIANWNGSWYGGGTDQLIFGSTVGGLTSGQVNSITFLNPAGISGTWSAIILPTGEIVPVPEPATIGFGALLIGALGLRERDRLGRWVRALLQKFARA